MGNSMLLAVFRRTDDIACKVTKKTANIAVIRRSANAVGDIKFIADRAIKGVRSNQLQFNIRLNL
ncbi:hypothetical protein D3C75_1152860 [compost metagenome]